MKNLGLEEAYKKSVADIGYDLNSLYEEELDPGLGTGSLGRQASCYTESMVSKNILAWSYGIRYNFGSFCQKIDAEGNQVELPDYWLRAGNAWEIPRPDV